MVFWTWILLSAMMVLIVALPSLNACMCYYYHPQSFFCNKGIVIKGQFLDEAEWNSSTGPGFTYKGYNIKVVEFLNGDVSQDILLVDSLAGTSCEYDHGPTSQADYLIEVATSDYYYINVCSFIMPWSRLSSGQIKGIQGDYAKQCSCKVRTCVPWEPCTDTENQQQCTFYPYDGGVARDQVQNQICAQNQQGNCTWEAIA